MCNITVKTRGKFVSVHIIDPTAGTMNKFTLSALKSVSGVGETGCLTQTLTLTRKQAKSARMPNLFIGYAAYRSVCLEALIIQRPNCFL